MDIGKKKSRILDKEQLQIRRTSLKSSNEIRMSTNGLNSRVSRERMPDMKRAKRVRFDDTDNVCTLHSEPGHCSLPSKGKLPSSFEEPKTSEYAFYKKLRKDAGHNFQSYTQTKLDNALEKFETKSSAGESSTTEANFEKMCLFPIDKVTPTPVKLNSSHLPRGDPRNSGLHTRNSEIFSTKRQKLLQWALEALSIDSNQYKANGYDLIQVLLQRLVPDTQEIATSSCMNGKETPQDLNIKFQLPVSSKSDIDIKERPQVLNTKFISPFAGRYTEDGSPRCWSNKSRKTILSLSDKEDSDSLLTGHANKRFERLLDDRKTTDLLLNTRSSFSRNHQGTEFSFDRWENLALQDTPSQPRLGCSVQDHVSSFWDYSEKSLGFNNNSSFKELVQLHDANEFVFGNKGCTFLLGGNDNNLESTEDFGSSSPSTVMNINPTWRIWEGVTRKTLNHKFDAAEFGSPSVLAMDNAPDYPLLDLCSETYIRSQVLDDRNYKVVVSDHLPLNLSYNQNCFTLAENIRSSDDYNWRSISRSPYGGKSRVLGISKEVIYPSSDTLQLPSSDLNFDSGLKDFSEAVSFGDYRSSMLFDLQLLMQDTKRLCPYSLIGNETNMLLDSSNHISNSSEFIEDAFNYGYPSIGFNVSLNKEVAYPLLVDNTCWERSVGISHDFSEDE